MPGKRPPRVSVERRARLIAKGICYTCGWRKARPKPKSKRCGSCLALAAINRKKLRDIRQAAGRCIDCGRHANGKVRCGRCRKRANRHLRAWKKRQAVMMFQKQVAKNRKGVLLKLLGGT